MYLSWCSMVLADWQPKPTPQHLSTEYRSRRDSPEESNMHNCISRVHFKWQSCEASHLCMHLITHSQTLKSPVPQVSERSQSLLVRTQSWRPSNISPKYWWDTQGDRQPYHLFFLHHSTETVVDECIKRTPLTHFGVACFLSSLVAVLYFLQLDPSWWLTEEGQIHVFPAIEVDYGSRSASSPGGLERGHIILCNFVFNSLPHLILNSSHYQNCKEHQSNVENV